MGRGAALRRWLSARLGWQSSSKRWHTRAGVFCQKSCQVCSVSKGLWAKGGRKHEAGQAAGQVSFPCGLGLALRGEVRCPPPYSSYFCHLRAELVVPAARKPPQLWPCRPVLVGDNKHLAHGLVLKPRILHSSGGSCACRGRKVLVGLWPGAPWTAPAR